MLPWWSYKILLDLKIEKVFNDKPWNQHKKDNSLWQKNYIMRHIKILANFFIHIVVTFMANDIVNF